MCEQDGRLVAAQVVDHDPPHKGDPTMFWDERTWRPLCKPHHDSTKQKQERTGRIVGCDASGTPPTQTTIGQGSTETPITRRVIPLICRTP